MSACTAPLSQAILKSPTNYQVQDKVVNGQQLLLYNLDWRFHTKPLLELSFTLKAWQRQK